MYITDNSRILSREELSTPEEITNEIPLDKESSKLIFGARSNISKILHGLDDRIIAVVGPCSIHDPKAAICLLYTSPSPRDRNVSRMPSSA